MRLEGFRNPLENLPGLDIPAKIAELEAELTAIFNR